MSQLLLVVGGTFVSLRLVDRNPERTALVIVPAGIEAGFILAGTPPEPDEQPPEPDEQDPPPDRTGTPGLPPFPQLPAFPHFPAFMVPGVFDTLRDWVPLRQTTRLWVDLTRLPATPVLLDAERFLAAVAGAVAVGATRVELTPERLADWGGQET